MPPAKVSMPPMASRLLYFIKDDPRATSATHATYATQPPHEPLTTNALNLLTNPRYQPPQPPQPTIYINITHTHTHTHTHNPLIPRADTCMRSRDRTRDIVILFRLPWTDAECQMSKALARVVFRILLMARHTRRNFMV